MQATTPSPRCRTIATPFGRGAVLSVIRVSSVRASTDAKLAAPRLVTSTSLPIKGGSAVAQIGQPVRLYCYPSERAGIAYSRTGYATAAREVANPNRARSEPAARTGALAEA